MTRSARLQIDPLAVHYLLIDRPEALRKLGMAIREARREIDHPRKRRHAYPGLYRDLASLGMMWIKVHSYWFWISDHAERGRRDRQRDLAGRGYAGPGRAIREHAVIGRFVVTLLMLVLPSMATARPAPADFAWQPHPGGEVPLDLPFVDVAGQRTSLRALGGVPVVLTLGYFSCPTLCGPVRDDLIAALAASGLEGGRQYRVAVLSIDEKETIDDAAKAKLIDLAQPGNSGQGWSYLVGPAAPVAAAIGFPYRWDADLRQFGHPAGIVVLTPTGRIASYLEGVGYTGAAMREAVEQAGAEQVAALPSPILLLCFHYDASTGKYTLEIYKVLRIMAVMTLLGIAGLWVVLQRRQRVT